MGATKGAEAFEGGGTEEQEEQRFHTKERGSKGRLGILMVKWFIILTA
jgi:hypothetical protein